MNAKLVTAFQTATAEYFGALAESLGLSLTSLKPDIYEIHSKTFRVRILCDDEEGRLGFLVTVEPKSRELLLADGRHEFGLGVIAEYYGESLATTLPFERSWEAQDVKTEIQMLAEKTGALCHRFLAGDMSDWQPLEAWFKKQKSGF